jgi:hypothetical protein
MFEINLIDLSYTLNIFNFLFINLLPDVIIADPSQLIYEYYKSRTIPMRNVGARTYPDQPEKLQFVDYPGPITYNVVYKLQLLIDSQSHEFKLLPSIVDTWPCFSS